MASDAWALCRELRRRAHLSQRRLAALAGVSPATIARIEKGRMEPTLDLMSHIVTATGLQMAISIEEPDRDERKAQLAARSLTNEERLRQNDGLAKLAVSALKPRDA